MLLVFILVLPLFTAPLFYLGSRAQITRALWSLYPPRLASFMDCAACSGFWYGFAITVAFVLGGYHLIHAPDRVSETLVSGVLCGLTAIVTTPLLAALHQHALWFLGSATEGDDSEDPSSEDEDA
jgi:hypothetical protein